MTAAQTLVFVALAATSAIALPVRAAPPEAGVERIGPLEIQTRVRNRVRGDRPENASLHLAYALEERRENADLWAALARFEDERLGDDVVLPKTIVDEAPEAWMRRLRRPSFKIRWNPQLVEYLRWYRDDPKGQALLHAWLDRLGRYEAPMRAIFREVGVPEDLVYVALVESGMNPEAQSGVGAAGMWQFMEATARVYGLSGDYWRDERFDYQRSAYAAAAYFADLKTRFGTWELAMAAYNAGYGLLVTTIRQNNTNNFWALSEIENGLPRQTINYVPKILATAIAAQNPEVFGYKGPSRPTATLVDVQVPGGTRLEDVAKAIEIEQDLLAEFNAHWIRGRTRPDVERTLIRIPKDKLERFEAAPEKLRSPEQPLVSYRVRLGEHIDEIAAAHGITARELRTINGIYDSGEVGRGVLLAVPPAPADAKASASEPDKPIVAVPALKSAGNEELVFFRVTRASTPRRIARAFSVDWDDIIAWNDLDPEARLVDGQMLQIFVPANFDPTARGVKVYRRDEVTYVVRGSFDHLTALLAERKLERRGYKVKKGESLARIAERFDLSTGSLARINGVMRGHHPSEGDLLLVYVPKGKTKGTVAAPDPKPTTIGFETMVLSGVTDESASTADDAKLPGQDREFKSEAATVDESTAPPEASPESTEGEATGDDGAASKPTTPRAPSTPGTSRLPGRGE